jgi:hypothetical protein
MAIDKDVIYTFFILMIIVLAIPILSGYISSLVTNTLLDAFFIFIFLGVLIVFISKYLRF